MQDEADKIVQDIYALLEEYNTEGVEISGDTDLNADLNIDSVAAMDLIMSIEDKFEIDIPLNLVSDVRCVRDLIDMTRKQIGG